MQLLYLQGNAAVPNLRLLMFISEQHSWVLDLMRQGVLNGCAVFRAKIASSCFKLDPSQIDMQKKNYKKKI